MVKSCVAIGCANRSSKRSKLSFYRFPAAIKRDKWLPTKHSWLYSAHFVSGRKSEDPLSPDYVPSVFEFIAGPVKRKSKIEFESYVRRKRSCLARSDKAADSGACNSQPSESSTSVSDVNSSKSDVAEPLSSRTVGTQTDLSDPIISSLEKECQKL